jgi:hypothetical protein
VEANFLEVNILEVDILDVNILEVGILEDDIATLHLVFETRAFNFAEIAATHFLFNFTTTADLMKWKNAVDSFPISCKKVTFRIAPEVDVKM